MAGHAHGTQYAFGERLPVSDQRLENVFPGAPAGAELSGRFTDVPMQENGRAIVKRMRQFGGRPNPAQALSG